MALKELDVTITEGRDKGKTFHLKEWPALRIEHWMLRVVFGLGRAGVEIPPEVLQLGAAPAAFAIASQVNKLRSQLGLKLADELMECVTIVEPKTTRSLVANDIEDFSTRLWLKWQVLKLMFGFFVPDASPLNLTPAVNEAPGRSEPQVSTR